MKKLLAMLLIIVYAFSLSGCTNKHGVVKGDLTLPFDMDFNGKTISVESVEFYQDKVGYSYTLYAVATLDISALSEDDIYWMDKEKAFDCHLFVSSSANNLSTERLFTFPAFDENGKRFICFLLWDETKYGFEDATFSFTVNLTQEETYQDKKENGLTVNRNKINRYYCSNIAVQESGEIKSSDSMDLAAYFHIIKMLNLLAS